MMACALFKLSASHDLHCFCSVRSSPRTTRWSSGPPARSARTQGGRLVRRLARRQGRRLLDGLCLLTRTLPYAAFSPCCCAGSSIVWRLHRLQLLGTQVWSEGVAVVPSTHRTPHHKRCVSRARHGLQIWLPLWCYCTAVRVQRTGTGVDSLLETLNCHLC